MLGGALVLSLATAITLTALDSRPAGPCEFGPNCAYDFVAGYSAAYAVSGILAAGIVLALALPEHRPKK